MSANYSHRKATTRRAGSAPMPRKKLIAVVLGAALTQFALSAQADSGVTGFEPALGNAVNPAGVTTARPKDPDGIGGEGHSRSPTGFLLFDPWAVPERPAASNGWRINGLIEFGGISTGGDKDAAKFREYKDLDSGFYLNNFWLTGEKASSAQYFEAFGGALGRDDQYVGLTTGRYNSWRVKLSYTETPHVFTSRYRNLWSGTGSDRLTLNNLPAGPVAPATAATTSTAIRNAVAATPYSTLSLERRKGSVRADMTLSETWKAYAGYSAEEREGARPFGLVSGGGGGTGGVEIPESVKHEQHDFVAGVQWASGLTSANLQALVSLFRNDVGTMTVDNPMLVAPANGIASFPQAVFDLYPENYYYNVKGEIAHAIPSFYRSRVTGVLSYSSSRQDDSLIPSTPYPGATVNGVAGGAWDTIASLSKSSANAKIDTMLADLGFAMNPVSGLDLKAKLRYYETSNDSSYTACNPLTGQLGRLINDGSGGAFAVPNATAGNNPPGTPATAYNAAACDFGAIRALNLVPSAGNVNLKSAPYEYAQTNISLGADYRFARNQNVNASIERETFDREHRERDTTDEDRLKLGYVNRALVGGTLRASVEYAQRRGSEYHADPYEEFLSGSLGPTPTAAGTNVTSWIHINDLHRKFDLADRNQWLWNLRWNVALDEALDLSLYGQYKDQKYPESQYGRTGHQRQSSLTADLNWQPTPLTRVYGFATYQESKIAQQGLQQNACALGSTYYLYSDGSMNTTGALTPAQVAAGITVVGNSGVVTGANFLSLCGTAAPTSPLYPSSRSFTIAQDDNSATLGAGVRTEFGRNILDLAYTRTETKTNIDYLFNPAALGIVTSGAPTAAQLNVLGLIGTGFPQLKYTQDIVNASLLIPVRPNFAVRLIAWHEVGRIKDWHYDGVEANPVPAANQQTYLDSGPQDYRAYTVGALLQFAF
jgi:hypothetical protein